jgi:virulence-associated protein VagC
MKRYHERLGNGVLINDGDGQIVVLPPEIRFRGTLVRIGRSDVGVYIEPLVSKPRASKKPTPEKEKQESKTAWIGLTDQAPGNNHDKLK